MTKIPMLWNALLASSFALSGCSIAQLAPTTPPDNALNRLEVATATPLLVGILWKMATTEKEALPKQILPYFGINEVPPVRMLREDYGWFSFSHQPPRFVQASLANIGVNNLGYHYNIYPSPQRETDRYSLQLIHNAHCITADEVISAFGQTFIRLPARVKTAAIGISQTQAATSKPSATLEKGSLHYKSGLFDDRGSITFQFDSQLCAELISINYTRKNP